MGIFYLEGIDSSMETLFEESEKNTPIVFVLSKGADPSSMIKKLGEEKGFRIYEKLKPISLGQG